MMTKKKSTRRTAGLPIFDVELDFSTFFLVFVRRVVESLS